MNIRQEQLDLLEEAAHQGFLDSTFNHLKVFAPRHVAVMGEAHARRFVEAGIERASSYGFSTEHDLWAYLELMILLGSSFDTDPQLPWASKILLNEATPDFSAKLEYLRGTALDYLAKVAGPDNELIDAAAARLLAAPDSPIASDGFVENLSFQITQIYPEKATYLGGEGIHRLIRQAAEIARKHRLATLSGVSTIAWLMLMLGSGVMDDLQFPWVTTALSKSGHGGQDGGVAALRSQGFNYLKRCVPT